MSLLNRRLYTGFSLLSIWVFVPGVPLFQLPVTLWQPLHAVCCPDSQSVPPGGGSLSAEALQRLGPRSSGVFLLQVPSVAPLSAGCCTVATSALVPCRWAHPLSLTVPRAHAAGFWFGLSGPTMLWHPGAWPHHFGGSEASGINVSCPPRHLHPRKWQWPRGLAGHGCILPYVQVLPEFCQPPNRTCSSGLRWPVVSTAILSCFYQQDPIVNGHVAPQSGDLVPQGCLG